MNDLSSILERFVSNFHIFQMLPKLKNRLFSEHRCWHVVGTLVVPDLNLFSYLSYSSNSTVAMNLKVTIFLKASTEPLLGSSNCKK